MKDPSCPFCRIVAKDQPAEVVLDRDRVLAFRDRNPVAPVHVLVVPKEHLPSLEAVAERHAPLLGDLVAAVNDAAQAEGIAGAFRLVSNVGAAAGQSVRHLHLHVLGGRRMRWPPG